MPRTIEVYVKIWYDNIGLKGTDAIRTDSGFVCGSVLKHNQRRRKRKTYEAYQISLVSGLLYGFGDAYMFCGL